MVTLSDLRSAVQNQLTADKLIRYVDVRADTIELALSDAALQLNTRLAFVEYEVLERGSAGFAGLAKMPWVIRAYENVTQAAKKRVQEEQQGVTAEKTTVVVSEDGRYYIHRFAGDIMLKVTLPVGNGEPVALKQVLMLLQLSNPLTIDEDEVKEAVKFGTANEYVNVGVYDHDSNQDADFTIEISADGMEAFIRAKPPGEHGAEISADRIKGMLTAKGVINEYDDSPLYTFVDTPEYHTPAVVARGTPARDGHDAYVSYHFETDPSMLKVKEETDGSVNYKELNLIQNVVAGQVVAEKIPAEQEQQGRTLLGAYIRAKDGKDNKVNLGNNVELGEDGLKIVATVNGQVALIGGRITVEPVYTVSGDVGVKTGNVSFLGTVVVKGNVDDGFNIKATGDIQISGTVGRCQLEADGNIIVALGIAGHDEGVVTAGKSLISKFIQNTRVKAGDSIMVSDGIVNSEVMATNQIVLQGKRGTILGGHLLATNLIAAKNIGSSAGATETRLEVGYDPKLKFRLIELTTQQSTLVKAIEELEKKIQTLENIKNVRYTLPPEKEAALNELREQQLRISNEAQVCAAEIQQIQTRFKEMDTNGVVSVSGTVYSGAKIYIRDALEEIRTPEKALSFYYAEGGVKHGRYEAPKVAEVSPA